MKNRPRAFSIFLTVLFFWAVGADVTHAQKRHAMTLGTTPRYSAGFSHFAYVNPGAPKGGTLRQAAIGTFDTFNQFTIKGTAAAGIDLLYDTLAEPSLDEPFTMYGLIAESMELADDGQSITFYLRENARFSDGHPLTSQDVVFSFSALTQKGSPIYRQYYKDITKAEALGAHAVRFSFAPKHNPELPLIIGQLTVLPAHFWKGRDFSKSTLQIPVGSGPYKIKEFQAGSFVEYERDPNYWGKNLGVNTGRYNFDHIRFDYYRDLTVALQALKSGSVDFRQETIAKNWATAYDIPAIHEGRLIKEEIPHTRCTGMQAFAFNLRRDLFKDKRVRQALNLAFDFEWTNKQFFYGMYKRSRSYFNNSELAATGLPSREELKLLEPLRGHIPDEVFTKEYTPLKTSGSGNVRPQLRQAFLLLKQAGWEIQNGQLRNKQGHPFQFEILLKSPNMKRAVLPFVSNLKKLGITATVRLVDTSQYISRLRQFDYDMLVHVFGQSLSPGNEQRDYWGSAAATQPGSRNIIGIQDKAIDTLIEHIIHAPNRQALITACHALDRVLLFGVYVIPQWYNSSYRLIHSSALARPATVPGYGFDLSSWWQKETTK